MGQQNHAVINFQGGLDLVSTHYALQQRPGSAKQMVNYEASIAAGYRRINGYSMFGTAQPSGSADTILGTYPYADGIVAVASTGVYFSTDGTTWLQVNRDTYVAQTGTVSVTSVTAGFVKVNGTGTSFTTEFSVDDHCRISGNIRQISSIISDTEMYLESEISGGVGAGASIFKNGQTSLTASSAVALPRTSQDRAQFAWYASDGEYGSLVISDESGNNDLAWFKITGTGGGRTYYYDVLDDDFAAPNQPKYITQFKERIVVANDDDDTGNISWSERLDNQRFDGAGSGTAQLDAPILAVKPLRDRVVIFTRNNIHQLVDIDGTPAILPISYNTGCASGWSVQELGGDLIFLSNDGIRTLTTSEQYGDVQFGNVARKVDPYLKELLVDIDDLIISSSVFRKKNQYRLFYTKEGNNASQNLALAGTLKRTEVGVEFWWSRLQGIDVACLESISNTFLDINDNEKHYHGGYDGYVYQHDVGNDFDGTNIQAVLELNEIDYGDIGRRKTLHYVKLFGDVESGAADDLTIQVQYDYNSEDTAQPGNYEITGFSSIAVYGTALFDTDVYGNIADFSRRQLIEGSGYSNRFIFSSTGTGAPYNLNSLYVDLRVGALL